MTNPEFAPFEVTFKMERADYVALCLAMRAKPPGRIALEAIALVFVLPLAILAATGGNLAEMASGLRAIAMLQAPWWIYPIAIAGPLLALFQTRLIALNGGRAYNCYAIADQQIQLGFEPDGLETMLTNFDSWVSWHAIEKIIETKDHAFLAISRREALILPRRAFASEADYRRVLGLVGDRIGA